ncbi:MAG: ABC transporter substrate-binding protein [Salibacteraceae bacterium]
MKEIYQTYTAGNLPRLHINVKEKEITQPCNELRVKLPFNVARWTKLDDKPIFVQTCLMKLNLAFAVALLSFSVTIFGCNTGQQEEVRIANGGIEYGHVFRINEVEDVRSLFPLEITEATGHRLANQVYEGLVKYDQKDLSVQPSLAESWEVNDDATVWTFNIRQGVYFHDDTCFDNGKGRMLSAHDVAWCLRMMCKADPLNQMSWLVTDRIAGASAAYNQSQKNPSVLPEVAGIEVLDDYTLRITLEYPFSNFARILGHSGFFVYPKEAYEYYGDDLRFNAVGTGPFKLKEFKSGELVVLERNPNYWDADEHGNQLPYLDAIQCTFVKDKKSELIKFRNGELDMVFILPIEMLGEVMGGLGSEVKNPFELQVTPSMSVHYYAFLNTHPVFKDVRVRKAFNMAVDKESIVKHTLQGEGDPGIYGIVPPAFKEFDHRGLHTMPYDPEAARELLAKAGYPNGEGFPEITLDLSSGGNNHLLVAQVVTKMLQDNLGVDIALNVLPMSQLLDKAEAGRAAFWRDGWIADYPDPENFLRLFVSDSNSRASTGRAYLNSVRYYNPEYDNAYEEAVRQIDRDVRNELYQKLDQMLIDDAVIMPIYYEEFTRLISKRVKDFPQNSIEYRDFSRVWISSVDTKS